jgi:hypothetical protein
MSQTVDAVSYEELTDSSTPPEELLNQTKEMIEQSNDDLWRM